MSGENTSYEMLDVWVDQRKDVCVTVTGVCT